MKIISVSQLDKETAAAETAAAPRETSKQTPTELRLAEVWQAVLGVTSVERDDNFFELGGDSLKALQVLSRVREQFGLGLPVQELFNAVTLAAMAAKIDEGQPQPMGGRPRFRAVPRDQALPLSFSQERMWFIHQLNPTSSAYNLVATMRLRGRLDLAALQSSVDEVVQRHESLRATFPAVQGQPQQVIAPTGKLALEQVDVRGWESDDGWAKLQPLLEAKAASPFDIEQGPLARFTLYLIGDQEYILMIAMHHLITDAWSTMVLAEELMQFYRAAMTGQPLALPPLRLNYADYAYWQRQWLQGDVLEAHLAYWRRQLAGLAPLNLPTDHPHAAVQTFAGSYVSHELDESLLAGLRRVAASEGATAFMVALATFQVLLYRYTAQTDLVVGVPVANRDWLQSEPLVGSLVNTLVLRADLSGNSTFRAFLRRVRQVTLEAYTYQSLPFAKLVAELNPARDASYTPIVQVMLNMLNVPMPEFRLEGLTTEYVDVDRRAAQFDLSVTLTDIPGYHRIAAEYSLDLFERETVERLLGHYETLLRAVVSDPDQPIDTLPLLSPAERKLILDEWNATQMPLPEEGELLALIRAQAARTPGARAVVASDETLTYAELLHRVERLAGLLQSRGIGPGDRVGVGLERTSDLLVAPLAVMAVGAAYVPLDPAFPDQRLAYMIEDARLALILTHTGAAQHWPTTSPQIRLDADEFWTQSRQPRLIALPLDPRRLAYVLYTSGSTGKPKGVAVSQLALVNFLCSMAQTPGIHATDVLLGVTTLAFDIAGLELYLPLLAGATLVIATSDEVRDGNLLKVLLSQHGVTVLQATPVSWRLLLAAGWDGTPKLRALCGGEALISDLARQLLPRVAELWNVYGPTETTIWSTIMRVTEADLELGSVPIGSPIGNTQVYVLDQRQQPVPIGVVGELYIGGEGVALGYFGRPDLTEARFVPNPFSRVAGARLYRTGDEARWDAAGRLHFVGRSDFQVKVRGFRIELGEIEAVLNQNPCVQQSVVVAHGKDAAQVRLVAYVELAPGCAQERVTAELVAQARAQLTEYMVPTAFMFLDHLPLTANGKVDRKALPAPEQLSLAEHIAPQTTVECELAEIWGLLLEVDKVGLQDDFFALGGHSLLGVKLIAEIEKRFRVRLPLSALFPTPTLGALARTIESTQTKLSLSSGRTPLVPIQPKGERLPFFCVHGLGGGVSGYWALAQHLGEAQPVYGLEARPEDAVEPFQRSIEATAAQFVNVIRGFQPKGPYFLGGYSYGGVVAFEMAQQLIAQGQTVGLLAMFETAAPKSGYYTPRLNRTFIRGLLLNWPLWWHDFWEITAGQRRGRIRRKLWARRPVKPGDELDIRNYVDDISILPYEYQAIVRNHFQAYENYEPKAYGGRVTVFRTPCQPLFCSYDPHLGWDLLALKGVDVYPVEGFHRNILEEPYVKTLAAALKTAIAKAQSQLAESVSEQ